MQEYRVYVDHLRVGVFIRFDLKWFEHPFLFNSFKIKSQAQIETLKELGISTVICVPEKSDQLPKSPSIRSPLMSDGEPSQDQESRQTPSLDAMWDIKRERIARLKQQRERFERCEKQFEQTLEHVKNIVSNLERAPREIIQETDSLVSDMVSSLLSDKDVVVHLMNTKSGNQDFFHHHSLNTAVLGLILGRGFGLEAEELKKLALGLIFHDIGKQRIDQEVIYKQTPLTPSELKLLCLHPQYGVGMISARAPDFPPEALEIVLKHHETMDGKGYPAGLAPESIPPLVRLASIANVYDNHCNKVDSRASLTPYQALAFMFSTQKEKFDTGFISLCIRCLGVYPPGTIVQLSNGSVGIVVAVSSQNSLRPSVLLYDPDVPKNEALVFDLTDDLELTILKSIHPTRLSRRVFDYLSPRDRVTYFTEPSRPSGSA